MRAAGDLVDAVGLARGDVHADKRDTGGDGLAGVRVHEVQVVVGVGEDLEQQGVIALRRGAAGGGEGAVARAGGAVVAVWTTRAAAVAAATAVPPMSTARRP